jgi:phytoene synthase
MNVDTAYAACAAITHGEARNFSYGIALLAPQQRRAMTAVYAAARRIDDIGDGDLPGEQKVRALETVRASLLGVREQERPPADTVDPVMIALADAAHRFPLPLNAFGEIVDGCLADVSVHTYATFADLVEYCRQVAGAVGRLSVGIYRPRRLAEAWEPADALGVALQTTTILRDVREDRLAGRVYLPAEDLERFGCRLDVDASGNITDPPEAFAALVRFEADRAQMWYDRGAALLPMLDRRSAACTAAMAGRYHRLLGIIAADPDAVRSRRLSLPAAQKAAVAARALARGAW